MLAASSQFDWITAKKWLHFGRPLSLIALDALVHCTSSIEKNNYTLGFQEKPPRLRNAESSKMIAETLHNYLKKDDKVRVKKAVETIINNVFEID